MPVRLSSTSLPDQLLTSTTILNFRHFVKQAKENRLTHCSLAPGNLRLIVRQGKQHVGQDTFAVGLMILGIIRRSPYPVLIGVVLFAAAALSKTTTVSEEGIDLALAQNPKIRIEED